MVTMNLLIVDGQVALPKLEILGSQKETTQVLLVYSLKIINGMGI
jgi:hypothetical protein